MDVLLVHGLARTSGSMRWLGRDLRRAGHRPHYFTYFAWAESYDRIVARLCRRLARWRAGDAPYAAIGHSLGGVLLREALDAGEGRPPALLILLGAPSRSPRMAQRAWRAGPFRWLVRDCGERLATHDVFERLPEPDYPYLTIAGTRGLYGRWSPFGGEPNDGLVAVSEARLGSPERLVTARAAHAFMMNNPEVRGHIRRALDGAAAEAER
jgi:pimeloyl-ACP methyl ester carboxylesterase